MSAGPLHYCPVDSPSMHSGRAVCGQLHVAAPWTSEPLAVIRSEPRCPECCAAAEADMGRPEWEHDKTDLPAAKRQPGTP